MTPFQIFDALLIAPFRLLPHAEAAFYFGTLALALASAALGMGSKAIVAYAQRTKRARDEGEAKHRSDLSVKAAQAGNKEAYLAQNHLAQEAYGNTLALGAGRAAALLWPGMIALAWLCWRFEGVPMPWLWESAGPVTVFLPPYIAALIGLPRLFKRPPPSIPL